MTLSEIRSYVRALLHDPSGDQITDARANRLINNAYRDLVNVVDSSSQLLNVFTGSGGSFQKNYTVMPTPPGDVEIALHDFTSQPNVEIRRPAVVWCKWYKAGPVLLGESRIPIVPYLEFDRTRGTKLYPGLIRAPFAVTFFRTLDSMDWRWTLRFVGRHPMAVTMFSDPIFVAQLFVMVTIEVDDLSGDNDVPIQVPTQFHRAIAERAAYIGAVSTGRNIDNMSALYALSLQTMQRQLAESPYAMKPDAFVTPRVADAVTA